MIPSCPKCESTNLRSVEIDSSNDKSAKLAYLAFALLLLSIVFLIAVYVAYWFMLAAFITFAFSIYCFKLSAKRKVVRLTCSQCGWFRES